jgi:ribosomal protein L11
MMAKVVITVDTEAGTLEAKVNGKAVENVSRVSAWMGQYYNEKDKLVPKCCVDINTHTKDDDGVSTHTTIMAAIAEKYNMEHCEPDIKNLLKEEA